MKRNEIFRQEEEHLAWTRGEIRTTIDRLVEEGRKLDREGHSYWAMDSEDRERKRQFYQQAAKRYDEADRLQPVFDSPYYARMDIETVGHGRAGDPTYIGNVPVSAADAPYDAEQRLVHDWREPHIRQLASKEEVKIGDIVYRVHLRRDLVVEKGILKDFRDNYVTEDSETLSDPYLLSVLTRMRGQKGLSEIIRSIQMKQNEIICHEGSRSFIVQGCAGSGKTQVLLHRLSYLVYNARQADWENARIITVNSAFSQYIADLSSKLEVSGVPRSSVEEYYLDLISRVSGSDWNVTVAEIEEDLPVQFLGRVYSLDFRDELECRWDAVWEETREILRRPALIRLAARRGIDMPSADKKAGPFAYREWRDFAVRIGQFEQEDSEVKSWKKTLRDVRKKIEELDSSLRDLEKTQDEAHKAVVRLVRTVREQADSMRCGSAATVLEKKNAEEFASLMESVEERMRDRMSLPDALMEVVPEDEEYAPVRDYRKAMDAKASVLETIRKERDRASRIEERIAAMKENALTRVERKLVEDVQKAISRTSFGGIFEAVFEDAVRSLRARCGVTEPRDKNKARYRHELYLRLLAAKMYYGVPGRGESALYIDEAQELSLAEYKLLQEVNGRGCAMELYGDVHQGTAEGRSLTDWDELSALLPDATHYELRENYRNTGAIARFCNEEFGTKIIPSGIKGEPVRKLSTLADGLQWLAGRMKEHPEYRAAIVMDSLTKEEHGAAVDALCAFAVPDGRTDSIQVLTVAESKGLEFESVLVVDGALTENQRYVAYTRAVDALGVVR